jgi:TRAP-type C4-dicarboxylate transport system substrate-binding protein
MDWSEAFTALQQGTVDGQENPFGQILDANVCEVNKFLLETKHAYSTAVFMISAKTWDKLNAQQQAAVVAAGKASTLEGWAFSDKKEISSKEKIIKDYGVKVNVPADRKVFREKVAPVYDKYPQFAEIVKQVAALRK